MRFRYAASAGWPRVCWGEWENVRPRARALCVGQNGDFSDGGSERNLVLQLRVSLPLLALCPFIERTMKASVDDNVAAPLGEWPRNTLVELVDDNRWCPVDPPT
jgi:hypothetical protein